MKRIVLILFCLAPALHSFTQLVSNPLKISAEQVQQYDKERSFPDRESVSRDGGIELPFIDDFSRYSLPTNDPAIPLEWQMWTDADARINNSLPVNAPTIGVATLDGLDPSGYPYNFFNEFAYGPADTLTSCPINLSGKTADDSVKLVFHFQGGGLGNEPDFADELLVEFLVPGSSPPLWQEVWSTPGITVSDFQRVFIHVNDPLWLQTDFQFRFRNYATLSGDVDHWHIDYVWLDEDIIDSEFNIVDVAATGHETSILADYNAVPWEHFQLAPAGFMKGSETVTFSNLDEDRNISFGASVSYEGTELNVLGQQPLTSGNGFSFFNREYSIDDGSPNNFVYPSNVNDTCADFTVKYYCNTSPDINQVNDTLEFVQHFGNYYAYDDGSAEGAIAANVSGSAMAMKYTTVVDDELLGLLIHFSPFLVDNSNETFLLRAWTEEGESPGAELTDGLFTQQPEYFSDGYGIFTYYEYDEPITIPAGDFFVGIIQSTAAELNIGNDRHGNANQNNMYFRLGAQGDWEESPINGSLMIRPVFESNKELEWDFVNISEPEEGTLDFNVFPNPTKNTIGSEKFESGKTVRISSIQGSEVKELTLNSNQLDISDLETGLYLIQLYNHGILEGITRVVKQ